MPRVGQQPAPADLIVDRATLVTIDPGVDGALSGAAQGELGLVQDGAIAIASGLIVAVGPRTEVRAAFDSACELDLGGALVTPGWVDAHTHPVWAGSRVDELERRIAGDDYVSIAEAGGGIMSTVSATRLATRDALVAGTSARLDELMRHGATTVEAKTGYGLTAAEEMRQLDVLGDADRLHPVRVVPTFLAAHAIPEEFAGRPDAYVDLIVEEMLPALALRGGGFVDAFCDVGAFDLTQTRRILEKAASLGLLLKVHSDEFAHLGCTALAAELGATSADHLVATTPAEMDALARAGTVAVLLPGTTLGLGSLKFAPAREMVARGVAVALGTDLNPGTCPCANLPLVMAMACRYLRLQPAEALVAFTRNAAYSCGRGDTAGRLAAGRPADLAVFNASDYRALAYEFGANPVSAVMIGGAWTWRADQQPERAA